MLKENIADLYNFMVVAEEGSFTKAAAKLGVTQSALSHAIKGLEFRLGNKLLERTTRKVSPSGVGLQLLNQVAPRFTEIATHLNQMEYANDVPSGILKIGAAESAAHKLLWPVLSEFLRKYPKVKVEVDILNSTSQDFSVFDAVIEVGESIYKDRKTVQLSNELSVVTVASLDYVNKHGKPDKPIEIYTHQCLGIIAYDQTQPSVWRYQLDLEHTNIEPKFSLLFNTYSQLKQALLSHQGIVYIPEILVQEELENNQLQRLFTEWQSCMSGFYMHYSLEMQNNQVFHVLIDALQNYGTKMTSR